MQATRRRFLGIAAAGTALGLAALTGFRSASASTIWRGIALGAPAKIVIDGNPADARKVIAEVTNEVERLEGQFSLHRINSAISRLNRDGRLDNPDPDFLSLMSIAGQIHQASGGDFDPTIQPLWQRFAEEQFDGQRSLEDSSATGWQSVSYSSDQIMFERQDMAITLNGIAQGYITDRIAELLTGAGLNHVLVDMGELRTIGARSNGSRWPVKLRGRHVEETSLQMRGGRALAVSHSKGTTFDQPGCLGHIIDPRQGRPMESNRFIAVEAKTAAQADGLSTALCVGDRKNIRSTLKHFPGSNLVADQDIFRVTTETGD